MQRKVSRREMLAGAAAMGAAAMLPAQVRHAAAKPVAPVKKKQVLAIGDVSSAYQHESVSHALATIERLGYASGEWATTIRTDAQLITKQPVWGTGKYAAPPEGNKKTNAKNLNDFDAVFFYGIGDGWLNESQKKDLLSFVHDDGKGFVGAHTAIDAFYDWPEFGEMMGGYFDNHPWGVADGTVIVEEHGFPGWRGLPARFPIRDEFYMTLPEPYSRSKVDVIARLDASKMDLSKPGLRTDMDFPVAWAKTYGHGNVFWSTFGHPVEAWDDARVQGIYVGALRWALGMREYAVKPHGMPKN